MRWDPDYTGLVSLYEKTPERVFVHFLFLFLSLCLSPDKYTEGRSCEHTMRRQPSTIQGNIHHHQTSTPLAQWSIQENEFLSLKVSHLICGILLWHKNIVTKLENSFQWFLLPAICCLNIPGHLFKRILQKWWYVAPRQGQKKVHVLFNHSLREKPFTML